VRVDSHLVITINEGATASAVAGLGIAASSESSARAELEAGQLVRMLPDWDFGSMEANALFVSGKTIKRAHEHLPTSFSGSSVLLRTAPARASPRQHGIPRSY
jgi:DNA-binding transcriptional LysR family regulator